MTDNKPLAEIDDLLTRSSLGETGVESTCTRVPDDSVAGVLRRLTTERILDILDPFPDEAPDYAPQEEHNVPDNSATWL
ncbi:hypothetical protein AB0D38_10010 [Streptomyces sp. NPDC048279]|uniref:hypothetical protein n=1 Tax=Streptomyces sp. NPDC048279 TaxID=3154714 RepID=UPI00341E244B